ncbi:hypothetical protein VNO80_23137 [Phaseolus coccineus]|uniref:Uncharacterized protein n=1 Tax=Phaseolus coccineus TaxID=3886 RepID=A0AAN9MAX0_PHACN
MTATTNSEQELKSRLQIERGERKNYQHSGKGAKGLSVWQYGAGPINGAHAGGCLATYAVVGAQGLVLLTTPSRSIDLFYIEVVGEHIGL